MKSNILKIIFITIMTIAISFGLFYFINNSVQAEGKNGNGTVSSSAVVEELSYPLKSVETGLWEALRENMNSFELPTYGGFEIYCINPGSPFRWRI